MASLRLERMLLWLESVSSAKKGKGGKCKKAFQIGREKETNVSILGD